MQWLVAVLLFMWSFSAAHLVLLNFFFVFQSATKSVFQAAALQAYPVDFQWLTDRTSIIWTSGTSYHLSQLDSSSSMTSVADFSAFSQSTGDNGGSGMSAFDSWILSIAIFMQRDYVVGHCSTAVQHAWPHLFARLQAIPQIELP